MALIYLIDDSPFHLKIYGKKLEERSYELRTFSNARAALDALDGEVPDLIVSDIVMPEMTGVELCAKVRERFPKEQLPLMLVSSLKTMEDMVKGYEAGADDYLVKPVRTPEFHAKVSLLLRQRRAHEAARQSSQSRTGDPPPRLIDRYEILDVLGEGAFGTVYKACRLGCDETVALKILSQAKISKRTIARFLRETEVLKTLGEVEGISRISDVGYDGEHYFYAMELVPGRNIRQVLEEDGPLAEARVLPVALSMARVLATLGEAEIVHRDIKPDNIVIGEDDKVTLIDFGLARLQDGATVTQRHEVPGTPAYIPPEAIRGMPLDSRGDMYSLGVTLFEALTGELPFDGQSSLFTLVKIAEGGEPNLEPLIEHKVSPGLSVIIEQLLANEPDDRYAQASELIADLEPLMDEAAGAR